MERFILQCALENDSTGHVVLAYWIWGFIAWGPRIRGLFFFLLLLLITIKKDKMNQWNSKKIIIFFNQN